jgi:predicted  nucleic acid-binding Zn-ribbon protein
VRFSPSSALNATLSEELQELKKDKEILLKTVQNWERNYTSIKHELDQVRKELAEDNAEKLRLHCLLQSLTEELAKREKDWSAAFAAAEEKHEDFKKKSHGILATMEENLRKKQEILKLWKFGKQELNLYWTRWKRN